MSVLDWLRERFKKTLPTPTNIRRSFDVARQFPQQYRERVVQPIQRAPQQVQRFVQQYPTPANYVARRFVEPTVNRAAVRLAGPNFSNWVQDLGEDTRKRGFIQGSQDLFNPLLMNRRIRPFAEPLVSNIRLAQFALLNPKKHMEYSRLNPDEPIDPRYRTGISIADKIAQVSNFFRENPTPQRYIKPRIQRYFQPTAQVRPRDVIRELGIQTRDIAREIPRSAQRIDIGVRRAFNLPQPRGLDIKDTTYTPRTRLEKTIFGDKPVKGFREFGGETLRGFGAGEKTAGKYALPVGIGLSALDITPIFGGKGALGKKLAKEATKQGVRRLLGKSAKNYSDDIIKAITREKSAKNIEQMLSQVTKKVTPKVVKPEIPKNVAIRTTRSGKRVPAIRQKSGIFAEKEFETHPFNEKNIGRTDNIQAVASTLDDIPQDQLAKKGFGPMMRLYNKISTMAKDRIQFVNTYKQRIGQTFSRNRLGRKDMDVVEQILDGKKPVGATELHNQTANELRTILDELRTKANATRKLMGKEEIGYIQEYSPRIKETSIWQDIIQSKDTTISEVMDFIVPNQKMNPHAKQRVLQAMQDRKVNLMEALDRYTDAIGNDVFLTPQIEKIKAVKSVLEGRGFLKTSAWLNDFIRHNLIGKPAKALTQLDLTGRVSQKVMGKITQARNLGALAFNLTWAAFTQPASMLMTISRAGLKNTLRGGLDWFTNPKLAREIMKTPTMVRKTSKGIGTTLGGDIDRRAVALYKGPLDKVNDVLGAISNAIEKHVTGASIAAGLRRAGKLGIQGKDKSIFSQYIGEVTQSMYDRIGRPLTLNPKESRLLFPFQTFSHEMFRYARTLVGKGGGIPIKARERIGQAISLVTGMYLYNLYTEKMLGRKIGSVGSFIPFAGSYVDEQIEKVKRIGKEALDIEERGRVGQATGRAPIAPMEDVDKAIRAVETFVKTGSWDNLRKQLVFWGMGLTGVGGATQVNRAIDSLIAIEKGYSETPSGRVRFPIEGGLEKAKAIIGGPYITKKGKEYIKGGISLLGEKQSELFKAGAKGFQRIQAEKQARKEANALKEDDKKPGFFKRLFNKEPETQEVAQGIYQLSDGKFYVKEIDKTFDTENKVQIYLFEKEFGENTTLKAQYTLDYERAKRDDDLNKYMEVSQARYNYLEQYKQLLDPAEDKKKLITIANEQGDILYYMDKFAGYGGFTKGGGGGGASITKQLSALNTDYKSNVYPLRLVGDATDYVKGTADYINKLKAIQATLPEGSSKWNSIQNKISTLTEQVTKTIGKGKKISLKFKKAKTKKLTGKASYGGIKLTGGKTRTASIRTQKRKGSPNIELWRK